MFELAVAVAVGLFMGALVALRYIAPKTANKYDDRALEVAEKAAPLVEGLKK